MMATRTLVSGLGLLLFIATFAAGAADVDFAAAVAKAQKEEDLGAVNRLCNEWSEAKPQDERPRVILGRIYLKLDKVDLAVEQFELAAEANPLSAAPRCEIGNIFLRAGKYADAIREYNQALKISPKFVPAFLGKARASLRQGDAEAALVEAQRAEGHEPDAVEVRALLGEVLLALGAFDDALAQVADALREDAENPDLRYQHAAALELSGRVEEAQKAWKRFLELEPTGGRAVRVENGWAVLSRELFPAYPDPAISPDGRHVAFFSWPSGIVRARLEAPRERVVIVPREDGWFPRHLSWSPDGAGLAYNEWKAKPKGERNRYVETTPDSVPEDLELSNQAASGPAWSPSGHELLFFASSQVLLLDRSNGESRKLKLVGAPGERLYAGIANYLPNGKGLVVPAIIHPEKTLSLCRVAEDTGKVLGRFADLGRVVCGAVSVSEDGATLASMALSKPKGHLIAVSTTPPFVQAEMLETIYAYARASWHPEGRMLVTAVPYTRERLLAIVRLGGLDRRPVRIATQRTANTVSVTVTSRATAPQSVDLRWQVFDAGSLRLGALGESEEAVELKPGTTFECKLELTPEQQESAQTVKVTALNQDGIGAVKLMDWAEEGE
ncbi:MAG: tetratricopeptide repeat protein [Lentisphaerae bacterium]|jgi:tetratricopeptide (TPR) repeat protein|nr:tetratricopeptide repeat protein [Lentisphaerota bacterium]MBT4821865.1 tetratricopeptide repeat protein [Lentisphaerota bacterium]MBT5610191.1 tetratricopeptide repeat protein [Lentisphaerota bacterium]MBT7057076.1 tetratricopeptide repeat protein [Lentisphaerota bacterium]MBT7846201.1 tetratricopeptide repeat protein [Lentisphaerota bacterium]